jgi:hypothetical protein
MVDHDRTSVKIATFRCIEPIVVWPEILLTRKVADRRNDVNQKHRQYKDNIVLFFMNMKDRIKVDDLRFY